MGALNESSVQSLLSAGSVVPPLHDSDLLLGQPIQLVHQRVDLRIGGLDLSLVELFVGGDGGGGARPPRLDIQGMFLVQPRVKRGQEASHQLA